MCLRTQRKCIGAKTAHCFVQPLQCIFVSFTLTAVVSSKSSGQDAPGISMILVENVSFNTLDSDFKVASDGPADVFYIFLH
jgi:hypothetical protein